MVANARFVEVAFVVARGRDRHIYERQHRHHLAGAARVADGHAPGPAAAVADDAAVTAGADHGVRDAALAQQIGGTVDGMALGEAAEVDAHAAAAKAQRALLRVEQQVLPAHAIARGAQCGLVRAQAAAVVVVLAHRGIADVEGAAREATEADGALDQGVHLARQRHRVVRGFAVDA